MPTATFSFIFGARQNVAHRLCGTVKNPMKGILSEFQELNLAHVRIMPLVIAMVVVAMVVPF